MADATTYVSCGTSVANRSARRIAATVAASGVVAAGQDEARWRRRGRRRPRSRCAVHDGRDDVGLPVARHDDQAARPDRCEHVLRLHRADGHAADDPVEVRAGMERLARGRLPAPSRASGSTGSAGTAARPGAGCRAGRGPARGSVPEPGLASRSTLFTIAPATWTPWRSKSAAFRTISSIGPPDAALADDDRRRARASRRRRRSRARRPPRPRHGRCPR